jgi:hypothetical protein
MDESVFGRKAGSSMNEGLLRQRRNLILVCAVLWLLRFGEVGLEKMSLAGFDVTFNRPEALYLAIWIAFAYFLYRYYQYFVRYGQQGVSDAFKSRLDHLALVWMARVQKQHEGWETKTGFPKMLDLSKARFVVRSEERIMENGREIGRQPFEVRLNRWAVAARIVLAVLDAVFRSTVGTDYLLPFLLALGVLLYCGSSDWPGGIGLLLSSSP